MYYRIENDFRNISYMGFMKTSMHTPPMLWTDECLNLREANNTNDITSLRMTIPLEHKLPSSMILHAAFGH